MKTLITFLNVFVAFLIILTILIQGRGKLFGGYLGGELYQTRRGIEKFTLRFTIFLIIIFFIISIINLFY